MHISSLNENDSTKWVVKIEIFAWKLCNEIMTFDYTGPKPSFKFTFLRLVICQRNLGNLSLCNYVLRELWVITMVKFTRFPIHQFANAEDRHPSVPDYAITDTNQWSDKMFFNT